MECLFIVGLQELPQEARLNLYQQERIFFSVDSRGLPTESAWIVGSQSGSQILDLYKQDNGDDIKNIAISNSFDLFKFLKTK